MRHTSMFVHGSFESALYSAIKIFSAMMNPAGFTVVVGSKVRRRQ